VWAKGKLPHTCSFSNLTSPLEIKENTLASCITDAYGQLLRVVHLHGHQVEKGGFRLHDWVGAGWGALGYGKGFSGGEEASGI